MQCDALIAFNSPSVEDMCMVCPGSVSTSQKRALWTLQNGFAFKHSLHHFDSAIRRDWSTTSTKCVFNEVRLWCILKKVLADGPLNLNAGDRQKARIKDIGPHHNISSPIDTPFKATPVKATPRDSSPFLQDEQIQHFGWGRHHRRYCRGPEEHRPGRSGVLDTC